MRASSGGPSADAAPSSSPREQEDMSGRPCWLLCYLRILAVQYTYIPGNPGVEFCELQLSQVGTAVPGTVHSVSTHSKCVLAEYLQFLPSWACTASLDTLPAVPVTPYSTLAPEGPTASSGGLRASTLAQPASPAPCFLIAFMALTIPASSPVLDLGSPACPQGLDAFQSLLWTCLFSILR